MGKRIWKVKGENQAEVVSLTHILNGEIERQNNKECVSMLLCKYIASKEYMMHPLM